MPQTRMFRDRVVSMEQTLEGGEKNLELLKSICREAIPEFAFREHALDHERDLFVMILEAPNGRVRRVCWTRMMLYDAERDEEVTYRLVTAEESDPEKGFISTTSPVGKSLMGKEEGDEVPGRRAHRLPSAQYSPGPAPGARMVLPHTAFTEPIQAADLLLAPLEAGAQRRHFRGRYFRVFATIWLGFHSAYIYVQ